MVKNVLEKIYEWGLRLDQKRTQPTCLPAFVVSVGNIAVGGRAKTPLVIDLVRFFREKGFEPVVLTRGYGRKISHTVEIGRSTKVEEAGDEPFEIYVKTKATILVGARRADNAFAYLQRNAESKENSSKKIFILDDGFQHWALKRDLDIVLINEKDLTDRLLPVGRLRESSSSLERADLLLNLDKDCQKKTIFEYKNKQFLEDQTIALTTRAGSQHQYFEELSKILGFSVQRKELRDHLKTELFKKELLDLPIQIDTLILGMKEAVKLFSMETFLEKYNLEKKDFLNLELSGRNFQVYLASLELEWDIWKFQKLFEEKIKKLETQK